MLRHLSNWSVVFTLLTGLILIARVRRDSYFILALVACASVPQVVNALAHNSPSKVLIYNLYTITEFIILFVLFQKKLTLRFATLVYNSTLFIYALLSVGFIYFLDIHRNFIAEWVCVNNILFLLWTLLYMSEKLIIPGNDFDIGEPFSIYIIAFVLYSATTILYFSIARYISSHRESILQQLETVHDVSNILLYLLLALGLAVDGLKERKSTKHI
jgi:hypothetical protein